MRWFIFLLLLLAPAVIYADNTVTMDSDSALSNPCIIDRSAPPADDTSFSSPNMSGYLLISYSEDGSSWENDTGVSTSTPCRTDNKTLPPTDNSFELPNNDGY
jgi:hypothetical protein